MGTFSIPLVEVLQTRTREKRSRWQILSAAPHRLMFFGGFLQLLLTLAWWNLELIGRYTAFWSPLPTVVFSTWIHGFIMLYGVFIFFIFGFLMTTYPRWLRGQEIPYYLYVPSFLLLLAGVIVTYIGLLLDRWLLIAGTGLLGMGWGVGYVALLRVYYQASTTNKRYEMLLNLALLAGLIGIGMYLFGLLTQQEAWIRYALSIGLWLVMVPIVVSVCHRMIPYFSSTALPDYHSVQPRWSLFLLIFGACGHFSLTVLNLDAWLFVFDFPLMLIVFHHSYHWRLRQSLAVPLLAMLHIAFLWLGIAWLLYTVQSLWLVSTSEWLLGKAPLHALTIGAITSLVVAMVSRVTLGHSGRFLVANKLTWWCFLGISIVALCRCLADLPPLDKILGIHANIWTACLWLLILFLWISYYLPMILKPRVDGKPG